MKELFEDDWRACLKIAYAAGQDAGNRSMAAAGRKVWSEEDRAIATEVTSDLVADLLPPEEQWRCIDIEEADASPPA